ncbi:MAG: GFA family protein [Nitratireductor sp.]|nr:GFA family protein [Nitratireductor sp.]
MTAGATTGGCQCGAVRYRVSGTLAEPHVCHCRMCQKAAGNYFLPLARAESSNVEITRGEPGWFHSSDPVRRGFCGKCGTPLFLETVGSGIIYVTLGSLDDPTALPPARQCGTEAKMPWFGSLHEMPGEATEDSDTMDGVPLASITASNHQHPDHDTARWPMEEKR